MELIGAVDVGGTKIAVGLVSPQGDVVTSRTLPTLSDQPFPEAMEEIALLLKDQLQQTGAALTGIGIGCTGQVDPSTGVVLENGFLPAWRSQEPARWLGDAFCTRAALENDAVAGVLAEGILGVGRGARRFIYITISTGIGGGLMLDGKVYRGAGSQHPEFGHHVIDPAGPVCFCGSQGCWETLASGTALAVRLRSCLPDFTGDAADVCDLAESGHQAACDVIDAHAKAIGIGLANLIMLYAPDVIALGGGLMRRSGLFLPGAKEMIAQNCQLVQPHYTQLRLSEFGPEAGLVGASLVYIHRFGEGELSK